MSADLLFIVGMLLLTLAAALWPRPTEAEPEAPRATAGCIDYRPQVAAARKAAS